MGCDEKRQKIQIYKRAKITTVERKSEKSKHSILMSSVT